MEEPPAEPDPDPLEREIERARSVFEEERRRVIANSLAVDRMAEAEAERRGARLWFGGTIALVLVVVGGLTSLVWRSFHGAARA